MDTIASSRKLIEDIARDNVKLILQPGTFPTDYLNATRELAPFARHVHVTNRRGDSKVACAFADGDMDWQQIVTLLRQAGFADYLSVEWFETAQVAAALPRESRFLRELLARP